MSSMPYTIVNADGTESGHYTGKTPRQAAMKAVKVLQGTKEHPVTFKLRELGVKDKLHVFKGYTAMEKAPEKRPAWMKETVRVAHVEKVGVEKSDFK